MPPNLSLSDLLARYVHQRERGQSLSPEELCRDAPEQLEELCREIAGLNSLESLLEIRDIPSPADEEK